MSIVLWGILAFVGGFAVLWWAARSARPVGPPLPADLPVTPLQRVARWSLGVGALFAAAAAVLVAGKGVEGTFASDPLRVVFMLLLLAILMVVGGTTIWLKAQIGREDGALDERDEAILGRASATQAGAILVTLVIWTIGLAEHFHEAGAVPMSYLYLICWCCIVVHLLGLPVGVLIGYRRG
jgi:ABC-type transport system involved in cytochrome c biogenesis permease subunit